MPSVFEMLKKHMAVKGQCNPWICPSCECDWWCSRHRAWNAKVNAGIIPDYDDKCLACLAEAGDHDCPIGNQIACGRCMQGNVVP